MKTVNKIEALERLEAKAAEVQTILAKHGYKHLMMMVTLEEMQQGWAGCHFTDTETVAINPDYYAHDADESVNGTLPHEIIHLYMAKYHPEEHAADIHGAKFVELLGLVVEDTTIGHDMPFFVEKAFVN